MPKVQLNFEKPYLNFRMHVLRQKMTGKKCYWLCGVGGVGLLPCGGGGGGSEKAQGALRSLMRLAQRQGGAIRQVGRAKGPGRVRYGGGGH